MEAGAFSAFAIRGIVIVKIKQPKKSTQKYSLKNVVGKIRIAITSRPDLDKIQFAPNKTNFEVTSSNYSNSLTTKINKLTVIKWLI
jgi:hypothetical protein